ncbi:MAG: AEC family transporter [Candidatus Limiplasma sp.]|nr:AEC family transporter [Candidatus Limiplasma sp.]
MDYARIAETLFKLGVAMAIGYVLRKKKMFTADTNRSLSGLILNVTCPALIVYAVCGQQEVNPEVLRLLGFGALMYLVLPLLAMVLVPKFFTPADQRGVYRLLLVFGNVNFMGFPVVQALYGAQAIFYINILNIPFTLLMFTYGVRQLHLRSGATPVKMRPADILTPGLIAGLLALFLYFTHLAVPSLLVETLGFVGGVTTPLSMVVIGSMIADFSFREMFSQRKLFFLSALKLLVLPALGLLVARLVFPTGDMAGIIMVSLAMPSASLCAMVCKQYGTQAQADTAALGVFLTTALSMVTLPIVLLLLR